MTEEPDHEYERRDRPTGILTPSQRTFLIEDADRSGGRIRERRSSIRKKIYNAILDFSLLTNHLQETDRKQVFDVGDRQRGSEPFEEFSGSLGDLIQFVYAGTEGPPWFNKILTRGVRNGEVSLETVEHALLVNVKFDVEYSTPSDVILAAEHIKNENWNEITEADLYSFVRSVSHTDALDIDAAIEELERKQEINEWFGKYRAGTRARIPGAKWTPIITTEVWKEQGYGEMSVEEKEREFKDLFGEGYKRTTNLVYDGEKVFSPPAAGSDEDPEILYWTTGDTNSS